MTAGGAVLPDETKTDSFTEFVSNVEGKLRHALTAAFGDEQGREAVAEALAYGWEHWDHLQDMDNPAGYRVERRLEDDEPAVALAARLHRDAVVGGNRLIDRTIVLAQRLHHRIGRLRPQAGAALDVGEEEGDHAIGQLGHPCGGYQRGPYQV